MKQNSPEETLTEERGGTSSKIARDFNADRRQLLIDLRVAKDGINTYSYVPGWLKHDTRALENHMKLQETWVKKEKALRKAITRYNKELKEAVNCGAIPQQLHEKLMLTPDSKHTRVR
jgi:hypothetical protein